MPKTATVEAAPPVAPPPLDQIEYRPVMSLLPAKRNARTHDKDQVEAIAKSIEAFGWTYPELVDEDGNVIAGHGRLMAARSIYKRKGRIRSAITNEAIPDGTVPVLVARGWTPEQKRAYLLADNATAERAGWDQEALRVEISELKGLNFDISAIGFTVEALAPLIGDAAGEGAPADGIEDPPDSGYKEQYGVIVICANEAEQKATYDALLAEGRKVKVVTT